MLLLRLPVAVLVVTQRVPLVAPLQLRIKPLDLVVRLLARPIRRRLLEEPHHPIRAQASVVLLLAVLLLVARLRRSVLQLVPRLRAMGSDLKFSALHHQAAIVRVFNNSF